MYLYDQLRFDQDEPAQERLRRVATEPLEEALTRGAGFRTINRLGRLVGAFGVRRSDLLAGRLRTWLWGYLNGNLPQPGEALISLAGDDLTRARQILGLWLAVTPPLPSGWPEHYTGKIRLFFDKAVEQTQQDHFPLSKPRFHLLTLLYRGLLKLAPEYAGEQYPTLCRLAHDTHERDAGSIWLSLCWKYGVLFLGRGPGMAQAFRPRVAQH